MSSPAKRESTPSDASPAAPPPSKRLRSNLPEEPEEEGEKVEEGVAQQAGAILSPSEAPAPAADSSPSPAADLSPASAPAASPAASPAPPAAASPASAPASSPAAAPAVSLAPVEAPAPVPDAAPAPTPAQDLSSVAAQAPDSGLAAAPAAAPLPAVAPHLDDVVEDHAPSEHCTPAAAPEALPNQARPLSGPSSPSTLTLDAQPWPGYAPELEKEWADKPWEDSVCPGADVPDRARVDADIAQRKQKREAALAYRQRRKADAEAAGLEPPTVPVAGCSSLKHYDLSDTLGEGTFGVVVRGCHRVTGQAVALKKLTVHDAKDGLALTSVREIKFLKSLRHPSIVPIVDMVYAPRMAPSHGSQTAKDDTGEIYMVEPYMDHDLAGLLGAVSFTIPQIKLYIKQFLEGVAFLHSNAIVHRDIKSANLLISNSGHLQIADFGLARSLHNPEFLGQDRIEYTGTVVTRWYRPPELLAGDRFYGPEVDLWGVGCILAEMFLRRPLFTGNTEVNQLELIAQLCGSPNEHSIPGWNTFPGVRNADATGRIEDADLPGGQLDFGSYPRILRRWLTLDGPIQIPPEAADLIDGLLQLNPAMRTPASKAIDHDWLWSAPLPADPASLPQYPSKKELDRKRQAPRPIPISQPLVQPQVPQAKPRYAPPVPIGHVPGRPRSSLPANPNLPPRPPAGFPPRRPGPGMR